MMTQPVLSCTPETNLATAAMEMWDGDCGIIPVIDADRKVKGVITDRDICMAVATKHRRAEEITAGEVLNGRVFECHPNDDLKVALKQMAKHQIRRIPVTDAEGKLQGIVSLNDLVLLAKESKGKKTAEISMEDVVKTMKAICGHRSPSLKGVSHAA